MMVISGEGLHLTATFFFLACDVIHHTWLLFFFFHLFIFPFQNAATSNRRARVKSGNVIFELGLDGK